MQPDRVTCPRCGANNFVGQPSCWQCQSSMPPPEAIGISSPHQFNQQPFAPPRRTMPMGAVVAITICLILASVVGAYILFGRPHKSDVAEPGSLQAKIDELKKQEAALGKRMGSQVPEPTLGSNDELGSAAQRRLQELKEKAGAMGAAPPSMGNDDIRLQGGGSLTKDQYQKALDSVKNSGRYHPP
ncbi:MAG: hypothetical protein ABJA67_03305 [Chthonomonadales bacterium]